MQADLIIKNAAQLVTPYFLQEQDDRSDRFGGLLLLADAAIACAKGTIIAVGETPDVMSQVDSSAATVLDAAGKTVLPGFVDAHTHLVFAATREHEFEMRIQGVSYQEIAAAGGCILSSVRNIRNADVKDLVTQGLAWLDRFLAYGTTTVEVKSGYGLSMEAELKMLRVMRELNQQHPVEVIPTFLGAHEIPEEYKSRRNEYIELVINEMIPAVVEESLAEYCDVFCEQHVFTIEEAERILTAALDAGLKPKIHADQLTAGGGAELAAKAGAVSADHLDHITAEGIEALRQSDVIPVLLPGAVFFLGLKKYAPARDMIDAGLPVAIATDFNPGSCPSLSMPMMMSLACTQMGMTPAEALIAATLHAARAVEREQKLAILAPGMQADIVVHDVANYKLLPYHFGMNFVETVVKNGKVVYQSQQ